MNESSIVKEYDFNEPDFYEIDFLLDDIIKNCTNNYFHTFKNKLVYEVKITNNSNNEEVNFTFNLRFTAYKTEVYGLNKKNQSCSTKWFYIQSNK